VQQAEAWFESGQLGVTFITAPAWVSQAFGILSAETSRATKAKGEIDRAKK